MIKKLEKEWKGHSASNRHEKGTQTLVLESLKIQQRNTWTNVISINLTNSLKEEIP